MSCNKLQKYVGSGLNPEPKCCIAFKVRGATPNQRVFVAFQIKNTIKNKRVKTRQNEVVDTGETVVLMKSNKNLMWIRYRHSASFM